MELDAKKIKAISDEVISFIKEKTSSNKLHIINFVLDQAKVDAAVANRLKHDPRSWKNNPQHDEC